MALQTRTRAGSKAKAVGEQRLCYTRADGGFQSDEKTIFN
jgi:hypothetical protein